MKGLRLLTVALALLLMQALGAIDAVRAAAAELVEQNLQMSKTARSYLVAVPSSYKSGKPLPLVIIFHGRKTDAGDVAKSSRMHELGEREGFITVYPQGLKDSWNAGSNPPENWAEENNVDDVGFIRAMIDQLSKEYPIDRGRIYAAGISNGGRMSYKVACDTDLFAAIASVAGPLSDPSCHPRTPVSILHIHGTKDWINPLAGGKALGRSVPSSSSGLEFWAQQDNCRQASKADDAGSVSFTGCAAGRKVELRMIPGGKHRWSQPGIDTSAEIWRFFAANGRA